MAAPLLFYDLSLFPSSTSGVGDDNSKTTSSSSGLLAAAAYALELSYAAVALNHPYHGLLAYSHSRRSRPLSPLSSLPLPSSAALHLRRLASLASDPSTVHPHHPLPQLRRRRRRFHPRPLRTYDLIAARPLT
ncbi:unnamed protein product [Urochloa humidicola]